MRELYAAAYREVQTLIKLEGEGNVWRLVAKAKNTSLVIMNTEKEEKIEEVTVHPPAGGPSRPLAEIVDEELRCVQCGAPVPDIACGRILPCRSCGYQYPLGDCSDYAEN
jgi:hypothetical protein